MAVRVSISELSGLAWLIWVQSTRFFFFFNDTATTEIYTLSLHDALPISVDGARTDLQGLLNLRHGEATLMQNAGACGDRKSTRLNSSHSQISYAVFCLKKKTICQSLLRLVRSMLNAIPCQHAAGCALSTM